jgi:hypothetical protein
VGVASNLIDVNLVTEEATDATKTFAELVAFR